MGEVIRNIDPKTLQIPLQPAQQAEATLQRILDVQAEGQLQNMAPVKELFRLLGKNGGYPTLDRLYQNLSLNEQYSFVNLITNPENSKVIFGSDGTPLEVREIIALEGIRQDWRKSQSPEKGEIIECLQRLENKTIDPKNVSPQTLLKYAYELILRFPDNSTIKKINGYRIRLETKKVSAEENEARRSGRVDLRDVMVEPRRSTGSNGISQADPPVYGDSAEQVKQALNSSLGREEIESYLREKGIEPTPKNLLNLAPDLLIERFPQNPLAKELARIQTHRMVRYVDELRGVKGKPIASAETNPHLELAQKYGPRDQFGAVKPNAVAEAAMEQNINKGEKAFILAVNINNLLKFVNDKHEDGHVFGDKYIKETVKNLKGTAKPIAYLDGGDPLIGRPGPNFYILLEEGTADNPQKIQKKVRQALKKQGLTFEFVNSKGVTEAWEMDLSSNTNLNVLVIDPAKGKWTEKLILRALSRNIHDLNKNEKVGQEVSPDPKEMKKLSLRERVVVEPGQEVEVRPLKHFDVFRKKAVKLIAEKLEGSGKKGVFVTADGNKIGAYRKSWGFMGDVMIDALFNVRFAQIAEKAFAGHEVTFVRYGPGSEEFYFLGEDMDVKTMHELMQKFTEELAKPFKVRIEVAELEELRKTNPKLIADFLSGELTGQKPEIKTYTYKSTGETVKVVEVDVNDPRGERGEQKGASLNIALKEITLHALAKEKLAGKEPAEAHFEENKRIVVEAEEKTKNLNGTRRDSKAIVDAKGEYKIFVPFKDKYYSSDYIETKYRPWLMELADGNPIMERILKNMTSVELAQIKPIDIEKGNIKEVAGPRLYVIDSAKIESRDGLMAEIDKAPENSFILCQSEDSISYLGTRAEVEASFTKFNFVVENGRGELVIVELNQKDVNAVARRLLIDAVPEAKESLEAKGRRIGGREDYKQEYSEALARIKQAIKKAVPEVNRAKVVKELIAVLKKDMVGQRAQLFFRNLGVKEAERTLKKELSKIDTKLSPKEFNKQLKKAVRKSQKVMLRINQKGYELLMEKVRALEAQNLNLAELPAAEVEKAFHELSRKVKADVSGLTEVQLDTEIKKTAELFKAQLDPRGKGVGAWMDHFSHGAPLGSAKAKFGAVGVNTARGALIGSLLEAPFSVLRQKLTTGEWNLDKLFSDMGHGALGWARFEAMSTAGKAFMGMGEFGAMGLAIGLPTLWSLNSSSSEQRGVILSAGSANLGGFFGASKGTSALLSKIPMPAWLKGGLTLAAGVGGGNLVSSLLEYGMEHSEVVRTIVDNPVTRTLGDVGSVLSTPLTVYYGGKLLMGVGSKLGWLRLASFGLKLKNATGILFLVSLANPSSEWCGSDEIQGDLGSLASGKPTTYFERGYRETRHRWPINLYLNHTNFEKHAIVESPLAWQLAQAMYKNGRLKMDDVAEWAKAFDSSDPEEIAELTEKLESSLKGVNYNSKHSIESHFEEYRDAVGDESYFMKGFGNALMGALKVHVDSLKERRGLLDEELNPEIRKSLKKEYVAFKVRQEKTRYAKLQKKMHKSAQERLDGFEKSKKAALAKMRKAYKEALAKTGNDYEISQWILELQYENVVYNFKKKNRYPLPRAERKAYLKYIEEVKPNGHRLAYYLKDKAFVEYYGKYLMDVEGPKELKQHLLKDCNSPKVTKLYQSFTGTKLLSQNDFMAFEAFADEYVKMTYQDHSAEVKKGAISELKGLDHLFLADLPASEAKQFSKYLASKYSNLTGGVKSDFYLNPEGKRNKPYYLHEGKESSGLFIGAGTARLLMKKIAAETPKEEPVEEHDVCDGIDNDCDMRQ